MKKLVWMFCVFFLPFSLLGQTGNLTESQANLSPHSKNDLSIAFSANRITNNPYESKFAGGFKLRMFVGERFSFDTDLMIGKDYVHFGPGLLGLPLWILGSEIAFGSDEESKSLTETLLVGALILLSAEHVAYHIPLQNNTDISPYVSLLRLKALSNIENSQNPDKYESPACFAVGFEMNKYFNHFVLSPYIDYNIAYSGKIRGFNVGVYFGYYFPKK